MSQILNPLILRTHRQMIALLTIALTSITAQSLHAGGYVDSSVALEAATAINTGAVSVTPTFNNDQFNDKVLVGTVNNDQIRTPSTADPVSTVSGNNYHDETDIQIPGRNGLNYVFTRTYNSAPSSTGLDRGVGSGWTHSYGIRLKSNDFGICPNCDSTQKPENANSNTSSITYTDERGGEQNFLVNETSYAVTNPKGVYDTLTLDSPVAGQHTLTFRNGIKYIFEVPSGSLKATPGLKARLKFIDNPWGDRLTLSYDASNRLSTVTDNLGIAGRTGLVFNYYSTNRLQSINDWTGRSWVYGYTGGDLTVKINPLLESVSYTYQPGHLLHEIIQPLQRNGQTVKTTFNYYRNGKTFNYHNALGQPETLSYDLYRKSTRVSDPRGGVREYHYDADGRMTKLTEPDGAVLIFENQGEGIRSKKYDGLGYASTYSYRLDKAFTGASDTFGNVSRERDALNHDTDTSYGLYDQVSAVKDKNGHSRRWVYGAATTANATTCADVKGKLKETHADVNNQLDVLLGSYVYDQFGNPCSVREYFEAGNTSRFRQTDWGFDANNLYPDYKIVNQSNDPNRQYVFIDYQYDNLGRLAAENLYRKELPDPNDPGYMFQSTSYQYDALDRVTKVTDPEGHIRETVYDANGQVYQEKVWHKQANGTYLVRTVASHQYDAADRRISTTDVLGNTTQFAYDEAGNLIKVTDANGHVTKVEVDAMNRKTAIIDGNGRRTETKYNLRGEAISVTNANGETTKSEYDAIDRLTKIINPLNFETRFQYDANGNQTCLIDANGLSAVSDPGHQPLNAQGCTETRVYDELNRLTQTKDAQGNITATSYDLLGNRKTITDAENRTTTFKYDDLGRLIETVDPLIETPTDKTQHFVYDEASNVIETTDRKGQVTRYTYDLLNRNTQTDHLADLSSETSTYDVFGDLVQSQNSAITYTYSYTAKHQLKSKTDSRLNKSLSWTYDPAGNIDSKTDYQGDVTDYQYDSANRLVAETNPAYLQVSYHYDGAGRLLDRILSNGARSHYGWDNAGRLMQLQNTTVTGQIVNNTSYTRDRIANILSQTEATGSGQTTGTTTFSYDPEYRLLSADYPGTANDESFTYDKVGNRKTHAQAGVAVHYFNVNAGNRLIDMRTGSATGTLLESYQYDDNGGLTSISSSRGLTITWDANNQVKQINSTTFNYDPSGFRIKKTGTATNNYYLEGEHLEAIYNNTGVVQAHYLRGSVIDEIVNGYQKDSNGKLINFTYHHDALQSVLGQSGHEGSILSTQNYSAFGKNLSQTGTSNNKLKYTGREEDTESGFYYYRARYYDPVTGRFISEDPKGFAAGVNFYAYVNNNPINANDPSGELPLPVRLATGVIGAGASAIGSSIGQLADVNNFSVKNVGIAAGVGFVAGFTAPQTTLSSIVTGGISNIAQYGITQTINNQAINNQAITTNGVIANGITGLAGGYLGGAVSSASLRYAENSPWIDSVTARALNNQLDIQLNTAGNAISRNVLGSIFSSTDFSSVRSASGGFVLYPNKSNTNMMKSVYEK